MSTSDAPSNLQSLGGEAPPPELGRDLDRIARLPGEAIGKLWQVLGPCLTGPLTPEIDQLLEVFRSTYRIPPEDFGKVIGACRFLVLGAVRHDATAEQLGDDLDALCPGAPLVRELILAGYERLKPQLRGAIQKAALADYGKVLIGVQWRLDMIDSTEQGRRLGVPVAMLSLHYQDGRETERITLQVLPEMMAELKAACEKVLSR